MPHVISQFKYHLPTVFSFPLVPSTISSMKGWKWLVYYLHATQSCSPMFKVCSEWRKCGQLCACINKCKDAQVRCIYVKMHLQKMYICIACQDIAMTWFCHSSWVLAQFLSSLQARLIHHWWQSQITMSKRTPSSSIQIFIHQKSPKYAPVVSFILNIISLKKINDLI